MTAPQIELLPLAALTPYAKNARTHSAEQLAQLVASLREFGFTSPILIDADGGILAGHGRAIAAQQVGLAEVPCLRLGHLTEVQKRAYILADNRLALNAGWDEDLLAQELAALAAEDYDTGLTGFGDDEIAELMALAERIGNPDGDQDPDAVPEVAANPISQPGDLWRLGRHRLLCGDSTQAEAVTLLMAGEVADLLLTDPPYGIGQDKGMGGGGIAGICKRNPKKYIGEWDRVRCPDGVLLGLKNAKIAIIWGCNYYIDILPLKYKWLIWDKEQTMPTYSDAEIAWTNLDGVSVKMFRYSGNGLLAKEKVRFHPTQKPVALIEWCIDQAKDATTIYEPFSGSGSTLIAAEQTGRRCYAMEISPAYVDVAVRRWQTFTGQTAIHAVTGQPFPG